MRGEGDHTCARATTPVAMAALGVAAPAGFSGNDRTSLMLMDHEFRELYRVAGLNPDGRSRRGRKTKHNTATRRWIDTIGFPMLARGQLPEAHDLAMLRSGPRNTLSGRTLEARDAWSQLHARDPRSKQLTDVEKRGQQTLLAWVLTSKETVEAMTRSTVQRGRPGDWKLDFGKSWVGWTPGQLLALAASSKSTQEAAMRDAQTKVPPGNYLAWFTNQTSSQDPFVFNFPRHFYLYLALRELEHEVSPFRPYPWALSVAQNQRARSGAHTGPGTPDHRDLHR